MKVEKKSDFLITAFALDTFLTLLPVVLGVTLATWHGKFVVFIIDKH